MRQAVYALHRHSHFSAGAGIESADRASSKLATIRLGAGMISAPAANEIRARRNRWYAHFAAGAHLRCDGALDADRSSRRSRHRTLISFAKCLRARAT